MNSSNRSVIPGLLLWYLANGHINYGWSITNVGFLHYTSTNFPTNLSIILDVVYGSFTSTLCLVIYYLKNFLASSDSRSDGIFSPKHFSSSSIIEILLKGGWKSISKTSSPFFSSSNYIGAVFFSSSFWGSSYYSFFSFFFSALASFLSPAFFSAGAGAL